MRNLVLIGLVIFGGLKPAFSEEKPSDEYESLYKAGKYSDALTSLEQSKSKLPEFTYVFNKGVIHHALGQDGLSVAYLERARALKPEDASIDEPLDAAKLALSKTIGAHRLDPGSYGFEKWGDLLPIDFLFVLGGVVFVLCILAFVLMKRKMNRNWGTIFFLNAGWVLIFGGWSFWMDDHPLFVLTSDVSVKSGPQPGVLEKGVLYAGTKVRRTPFEERDGYIRVRYSAEGEEGFIEKKSLLLLSVESNKE